MAIIPNVIIIFSIIGIGFGAGLHLNLIDDNATMYRIQNLIPKNLVYSEGLPFFNLAFMSGQGNGLISHATVAFGLGTVVIDPNKIPNDGDEYFDNLITQCEFHSGEDIDEPICIVCRIKDTHEKDPCVDQWLGFTEFEHGTLLYNEDGFPNAAIPGVTVTAIANTHSGGGENAVMIFDGDTLGGFGEGTTPDPDLRADADCPDCAGLHIAVIAENTAGGADGVVDSPDDNAIGGMQTWVFDQPWFLSSFDFVDYDRSYDGEARAYDNPECSGTPVGTAAISRNPNGGDGSVQTIILNANNVRCLEVEYRDSGGITNIHLECIKKKNLDDVIAVGLADLPDGYTASSVVPIPLLHGGVDVTEAQSVQIEIGKSLIDFDGLSHGDNHATISGYLLSNFGITLEIDGDNGIDEALIYNSFNVGGADTDLEHPLNPDDQSIGNLLIMKEDSGNQPNDSGAGGIIRFKSVDSMSYVSIDVVDHDNNGGTSEIRSYENFDCTGLIDTSDIVADGNNNVQTVQINDNGVKCLEIFYKDSGGFTNLLLGCLGAFHEPCVDRWLGLTEFPHGTLLYNEEGFPNAVIPGVTITAVANTNSQGGVNAVMIFDGDGYPGGDDIEDLTDPDPDLRVSGHCPDCAGKHIAVIAERIVDGEDGVVNLPDDNANGGIQTWVFDQPWFVESFVYVDYEESPAGAARAYSEPDCTGLVATAAISNSPNGGDASVQTIFLNANNVRCVEFEYEASGGITDVHLECPKPFVPEKEMFFHDSFEDENTIWGVWYKDDDRTTTPYPGNIWFGQQSIGELGAHTGTYYLGGSGNIDDLNDNDPDPDWAAKNRYIDISQYTDIWLSFWYSFDNTEDKDDFAMYYKVDDGAWQEIFVIVPETIPPNEQEQWEFVEIGIPDGDGVYIQFRWETSAGAYDDMVMIDDLWLSGFLK